MNKNKTCLHHTSCSSTAYTGISNEESQIIIHDIIDNKQELVKAINDKGGNAQPSDSMNRLANKIRGLLPAQPVFHNSDIINPYWTNLVEKIGEHYREDRKHCWAFCFLGENETIELSGGEYYICSDGFETDTSQSHTFRKNLDPTKKDNWVIIYTPMPIYNFSSTSRLTGAVFYHTSQDKVLFQNTKPVYILQEGITSTPYFSTNNYYCQNIPVTFFTLPEGTKKANFGSYAFDGCKYLRHIPIPEGLTELTLGELSFRNTSIHKFIIPPIAEKISIGSQCFYGVKNMDIFEIKDSPHAIITLNQRIFENCLIKKLIIGKCKSLSWGYSLFVNSNIQEIAIENPSEYFVQSTFFANANIITFRLGEGWNWNINLTPATLQSTESMVQNCKALANRTGQSKLTLTYGAAKLAVLATERPDMIELAQAKNWNIV